MSKEPSRPLNRPYEYQEHGSQGCDCALRCRYDQRIGRHARQCFQCLIIGFNVRPDANARKAAETEQVDIRTYRVIYDALNDVEAAIKGMLAPKFREKIIGHVEIRKVIPINKNLIAGAYVKDGKITRNAKIRLVRDGIIVHEGELDSLRRFKDDVKEVAASYECGLTLADYRDIKEGDQLEVYIMEEVAAD